ncbi:MAG: 2-oxoacid:acceptor oxidoreductase family protein [Syntrophaceae bacterium]|nr:2-oxoacid:acceptor oxidoreductase family protein [Syntrophaceae bacterium]
MIEIRWHARGGQGGFTGAKLLGLAASVFCNHYAQAFPSFGPERRGAPVLGFTRIDDKPITDHSQVYRCDYVVVLDETLLETVDVTKGLIDGGTILINTKQSPDHFSFQGNFRVLAVDASTIALEEMGTPIANTAMLGAFAAVNGLIGIEPILKAVDKGMPGALRERNKKAIERTYAAVRGGN